MSALHRRESGRRTVVVVSFLVMAVAPWTAAPAHQAAPVPVGLSLYFQNGTIAPLFLAGQAPRFLQELDIVASVTTATDQGVAPLATSGDLAGLDWTGVAFVEDDWRPAPDGTFTRQRFFRGARWMNQDSQLSLSARNQDGAPLGPPIVVHAGADDRRGPAGDFFVRRFVARQITTGCAAVGDCARASSYTAQGLVSLREPVDAEKQARLIAPAATELELFWSADPHRRRAIALQPAPTSPVGSGFQVGIAPVAPPANGQFYRPGDVVSFRVTFRDGEGRRLHPEGSLPTFADFLAGRSPAGLRYIDLALNPTVYYALKKRESNLVVGLSGPTDRLRVPRATVQPADFFAPQVATASVSLDGYTALVAGVPPLAVSFGGLVSPAVWDTPVSDLVTFTIPADALPGTYVVAVKARRDFGGEALNRAQTISIQIGTATPTGFAPTTGHCTECHQGPSALGTILHGLGDRRACSACHPSLFFEPDNALDIRVHFVHSRSRRFPGDVRDCSLCHTSPPQGPARGMP
jgi:hypothetical protein